MFGKCQDGGGNSVRLSMLMASLLWFGVEAAQLENARVGMIDFYGLGGLDADRLRAALSVRRGDPLSWPETPNRIKQELAKVAGRPYTHLSPVCCDKDGLWMLYIGFSEKGTGSGKRPRPAGDVRLAGELTALYGEFMAMLPLALKEAAGRPEDYSKGYSLSVYPPMRAIQLRMREAAVAREAEVLRALAEAADDQERTAASALAGYTRQSTEQIAALMEAARDANDTVRNNATRALAVLAATPEIARKIPAEPFIESLNSSIWSDRNKGLMLLMYLTADRNPVVLRGVEGAGVGLADRDGPMAESRARLRADSVARTDRRNRGEGTRPAGGERGPRARAWRRSGRSPGRAGSGRSGGCRLSVCGWGSPDASPCIISRIYSVRRRTDWPRPACSFHVAPTTAWRLSAGFRQSVWLPLWVESGRISAEFVSICILGGTPQNRSEKKAMGPIQGVQ